MDQPNYKITHTNYQKLPFFFCSKKQVFVLNYSHIAHFDFNVE